jgi:hypothetical protein
MILPSYSKQFLACLAVRYRLYTASNVIFGFQPLSSLARQGSPICGVFMLSGLYSRRLPLPSPTNYSIFDISVCVAHVAREEAKMGGGGRGGGYHASFVAALHEAYPGTKKAGPKDQQNKSVKKMKILFCTKLLDSDSDPH